MISDTEMAEYREGMSADQAIEMARVYRTAAQDPAISRPGDQQTADIYQKIADRKRKS